MFAELGPAGVTGLRLWWSALIVAVIGGRALARTLRTVVADRAWRDLAVAVAFGVVLGIMNFSIYQSFARIPLGVAVTIEFLGPLAVAVASSRRWLDVLWVVLAAAGVLSADRGRRRPAPLNVAGIAFGLVAAAGWAAYILLSRATGRRFGGSSGLVIAMVVAAVVVTGPAISASRAGAAAPRRDRRRPGDRAAVVGDPVPARARGAAPRPGGRLRHLDEHRAAVAALVGLLLLSEALLVRQWLAILLVIVACAGAARYGASEPPDPDRLPPPPA